MIPGAIVRVLRHLRASLVTEIRVAAKCTAVALGASVLMAGCSTVTSPSPAADVQVTLGIYSGRPDPSWTLTTAETAALDALLADLPSVTGSPPAGGLGYHGFTITRDGSNLVAYRGAVAAPGNGPRDMQIDAAHRVERFLLGTARTHLTASEFAMAQAAIEAP